jgi:hypothetical protein
MKISIALTLIITIAVFSYVSGYSIGAYNKKGDSHIMVSQANIGTAAANISASSGDHTSPGSENKLDARGSSPGYGAPSPGYGQ